MRVRDVEGHFCLGGLIQAVIAADADDFPAAGDHKGHTVVIVQLRETAQLLGRKFGLVSEKTQINGVLRLRHVESLDGLRIICPHGTQMSCAPIAKNNIGFPMGRIFGR